MVKPAREINCEAEERENVEVKKKARKKRVFVERCFSC